MGAGVGVVSGVLDQIGAEQDAKNRQVFEADPKNVDDNGDPLTYPLYKQWGVLFNYVVPVVEVGLVGFDIVKGDLAGSLVTSAAQLAARGITQQATSKNYKIVYSPPAEERTAKWTRERAAAAAAAGGAHRRAPAKLTDWPAMPGTTTPDVYTNRGL
jgi:hypothetical protein